MKEFLTTIMCLSFVTGTYECIVEIHEYHVVRYTGGGIMGYRYDKRDAITVYRDEDYVRSHISESQWSELCSNGIVECKVEL